MITIQTDGATNIKTNKSGAGIYIKKENDTHTYAIPLQFMSNHEAEFQAALEALKICNEKYPNEILAFQSDSTTLVDAIEKQQTKNKQFKPYLKEILQRAAKHPHFFIKWIPSSQNKQADQLAKQAIYQT